jgi:hypothetical protein
MRFRRTAMIAVAVPTLTLALATAAQAYDYTNSNTCDLGTRNYPIKVTWRDTAGSRRPIKVTIDKPVGASQLTQFVVDFVDNGSIVIRKTLNDQQGTDGFILGDQGSTYNRSASHTLQVKTKATITTGSTCSDTTND